MQIRTMKSHFTLVRMAIIKKKNLQINPGEGVEKKELFYTVDGKVNWCMSYGEQNGGSFKKTKNRVNMCVLTQLCLTLATP